MLLDYAQIEYDADSLRSTDYGDIYFNPQQGFAESEYVFIQGNRLIERFSALAPQTQFVIGETGFGSGMNCLLAVQHFLQYAPQETRLCYISCEKHPIRLEDLQRIQHGWLLPEIRQALYQQYPHNRAGFHWLHLHSRIDLLLLWGEANQCLPELHASVDAWFLDGFAPSKNTDLWSETIFNAIAHNSHLETSAATFSAARQVREGLAQADFAVEKQAGFGHKREMLTAKLIRKTNKKPHWTALPPAINTQHEVKIIGAGLAGMASAWALANKGIHVSVYCSPHRPAASQVPIAVPYLQVGLEDTPIRQFQLAAWRYNKGFFAQLTAQFPNQRFLYPQEIVLSANDEKTAARHRQIASKNILSADEFHLDAHDNLILHGSGLIDTPALLTILGQHPLIKVIEQEITSAELSAWKKDTLIFATAWHHELLASDWHRHLRPLRGQACIAKVEPNFEQAPTCAHYSILPFADKRRVYIGSAYQPNCNDGNIRLADNQQLLDFFHTQYPQFTSQYDSAFAGVRASTRDYLPLIGPLANPEALRKDYQRWQFDRNLPIYAPPNYPSAWYIHAGLGSKGCLTAFYGAEILTAMLLNTPLPISRHLLAYLLPARSIIRDIIRHQ